MNIRIKKENKDGIVRLESSGEIREILINEDFMNPGKENIAVCFRGKNSSGIIDFTPYELEQIIETVKGRLHLIKGIKKLRD